MKKTLRIPIYWLLKESEGLTYSDRFTLFLIKLTYLCLRLLLRLILGKESRDRLYIKHDLDFGAFWYYAFKFLRPNNTKLFKFRSKKYGFEFFCRNNKDDFKLMTIHEDELIQHFVPEEGDIVVDVGAHIGLYTIIASKRVGLSGKVFSIEPDPMNFEILLQNIRVNHLENVVALKCAAYSEEGDKKLYLHNAQFGFTKYDTLMPYFAQEHEKFVMIKANTLDNLMSQYSVSNVKWIKIDVEGAEYEVLKGARSLISTSEDLNIIIEVHSYSNYTEKLLKFIESHKLKIKFEKTYKENGSMHVIVKKEEKNTCG